MNVLERRLADISIEDIQQLVERAVQEGPDLEYKKALATKDGKPDRWLTSGNEIGDEAKRDLVKELIGFANARGGTLVLGIEESKSKPSKAAGIVPIPKVDELADRLKMACRDLIEPRIHSLEVAGVRSSDDGAGVVIFRVNGSSPFGPHRHRATKECYLRRNDETVPMDMIEIQRHSVAIQNRLTRIDEEFARARAEFLAAPYQNVTQPSFAIHIHARPLSDVLIPKLHRIVPARPTLKGLKLTSRKGDTTDANVPVGSSLNWRPALRATKAENFGNDECFRAILSENGAITIWWACHHDSASQKVVYLGWLLGIFSNALLAIERLRLAAKSPQLEYALDFTYQATLKYALSDYDQKWHQSARALFPGPHVFPRYAIDGRDAFPALAQTFENDVLNLVGADKPGEEVEYIFLPHLEAIDREFATL